MVGAVSLFSINDGVMFRQFKGGVRRVLIFVTSSTGTPPHTPCALKQDAGHDLRYIQEADIGLEI